MRDPFFLPFFSGVVWGMLCVYGMKQELSVSERTILDLASLSISTAKSVSHMIFHKHSFSFLFFFTFFLDIYSLLRSMVLLTFTDFKLGLRNRWVHTESRSPLTLKLEDIQIWSRLGSSSFAIVLYFPILLSGSLFLAGRGTMWWCTVEPHSPNRSLTKKQGLPLQLTHQHQEQTVTRRFQGGESCSEHYELCSLLGMVLPKIIISN